MRRTLIALLLASVAWPAFADKRVALVMAADDYEKIRPLDNAVNDAQAIEESLEKLGFEVNLETDRDLKRMRRALEDFREDAEGADVALVYFAGHGVEIDGENRLLPTDADAATVETLKQTSLPLEEVRQTVASISKVGLILLDACRNDPFAGGDGGGRGAKALNVKETPEVKPGLGRLGKAENLLYTFSAAPGATAADGSGENSPFTAGLAKYLATDGLEIRSVLTLVQQEVYDLSRGSQLPYVENGLPQLFFASTQTSELPERERLLLAMADVTADLREEVERLAAEKDMPLAPLYGALISSDARALSQDERVKKLTDAADAFVSTRNQIKTMASSDPAVAKLRDEAETQLALGAFDTARGKLSEAATIDSTSRDALKANFLERTTSEATTHIISGGASRADLKYDLAIESYRKAATLFDEVSNDHLPEQQRQQQLASLETLGDLYLTVGNLAEGRKAYERQQAVSDALIKADSQNTGWQSSLASSTLKLGDVLRDQGDSAGALVSYERGLEIRKALAAANPQDSQLAGLEAAASLQIGALHNIQGNSVKALVAYAEAQVALSRLIELSPANDEAKAALARSHLLRGRVLMTLNTVDQAETAALAGLTIAKQLAAAKPDDPQLQFALADAFALVGEISRDFRLPGDKVQNSARALEALNLSVTILRKLAAADPSNLAFSRSLAGALENNALAERFNSQAAVDFDRVLGNLNEAVGIREHLAQADPTNKLWVGDLAATYANTSTYWAFVPDEQKAIDFTKKAHSAALQLAALDPKNVDWQRKAWGYYAKLSESHIQLKEYDQSLKYEQDGLAFAAKLAAANPEQEMYWQDVSVMQDRLARVYWIKKDWKAYWPLWDKRLEDAVTNAERFPTKAWPAQEVSKTALKVAGSWVANDPKRALRLFEQARAAANKATALVPDDERYADELATAYLTFGTVLAEHGDRANARAAYEAALDTADQAAKYSVDISKFSYSRSNVQGLIDKVR